MGTLAKNGGVTGETLSRAPTEHGTEQQQAPDLERSDGIPIFEAPTDFRRRPVTCRNGTDLTRATEQASDARDECVSLARRARDAFKDACSATTPDESEAAFASAKHMLDDLWEYAYLRDRPFRDLLALLDAALKRAELAEFKEVQRNVLRKAFCDLPRWILDEATVEGHIIRFADHDVDITSPLRSSHGKRLRVKIEVIEE